MVISPRIPAGDAQPAPWFFGSSRRHRCALLLGADADLVPLAGHGEIEGIGGYLCRWDGLVLGMVALISSMSVASVVRTLIDYFLESGGCDAPVDPLDATAQLRCLLL